jgi:hypothetical protein
MHPFFLLLLMMQPSPRLLLLILVGFVSKLGCGIPTSSLLTQSLPPLLLTHHSQLTLTNFLAHANGQFNAYMRVLKAPSL